ncbi:transposase [Deinococcus psychrotolerans]|uniref:transposase n=1 Tax=Deinococcus psychrotolerans TaxID=2489213 RepID=UPI002406A34D|nr:transposase [Deinococcus psychrotolerans]
MGGEGGRRLPASLLLRVSGERLLTEQQRICPLPGPVPRVVGIDDLAFKKGLRYENVIVNLETRQAIDLLPDRKAETVTQWLLQHPKIEIISRDRSTEYERASREGAERQARYERQCGEVAQIKSLAAQGQSALQIARDLHRNHHFVRFSLRVEQVPPTRHPPWKSKLDPYDERLWEPWQAGERNAMTLLRKVQQEGFPGGYKIVHQETLSRRIEDAQHPEVPRELVPAQRKTEWRRADFLVGQVVWIILENDDQLGANERTLLKLLMEKCVSVSQMRPLALEFRWLFAQGDAQTLDGWLEQAASCGLPDIQTLAISLAREREALLAAMTLPWSNGPMEGIVNKIKLSKRQMYGRGSFETLRTRVLFAS